jgi:hypothetical protein
MTVIGFILLVTGTVGLALVVWVKLSDKLSKKYIVYWKDVDGSRGWTPVNACTDWGAKRMVRKSNLYVKKITRVVRQG